MARLSLEEMKKRVWEYAVMYWKSTIPSWDCEEWETVETTAETICTNPAIVIEYLLNIIEN